MSDQTNKGAGQGRGAFTRAGVQRQQGQDIVNLQNADEQTKAVLTGFDQRLTAIEDFLEGGGTGGDTGEDTGGATT